MERRTVITNFIWRLLERFGAQTVTAVVSLVLARLLDPEDYGAVALVTVVLCLTGAFIDSGLGSALIQKKDADELDFSSVFYFNVVMCIGAYGVTFLVAPLAAAYFRLPELSALIRVQGLTLVLSGVKNVQQAYVSRNMLFKKFFFATLGGTLGAAVLGVWMALNGFGVWALVAQSLFNTTVDTLILWLTVPWRPRRMFSRQRLRGLLSFGWKLLAQSLLNTLYNNLRQLIIGRKYTAADLGLYNRGYQFPAIIAPHINDASNSVLVPALAQAQDDPAELRGMVRRATRVNAYLLWPLMMGLAAVGEPLVRLVLTEKWLPCIPYLRIFCLDFALWPFDLATLSAFNALGRSDVLLKLEIVKKSICLAVLVISMHFGVLAMAVSVPLLSIMTRVVDAPASRRLLNYSYGQKLRDTGPAALLACGMACCVWAVGQAGLSDGVTLLIQVPLGVLIYVGGSWVLRLEDFRYLLETARQFLKRD